MNDKTKQALTDTLIDQIESAARASFRRHQGSIKGQILTAADNYDFHLLHAAYQAGIHTLRAQLAEAQRELIAKEAERAAMELERNNAQRQHTMQCAINKTDSQRILELTDPGMTLRDYFAAKAMHALIVEPPWGEGSSATVHAWSKGFPGDDPCERFALAEWDGQEAVDGGDLIRMLIGAIRAGAKERGE